MKVSYWYKIIVLLIIIILTTDCEKKEQKIAFLVDVNGHGVEEEYFIRRFQQADEFKKADKINLDQVKNFLETNFVQDLLFLAEAYALNLENDSAVVAKLENEKERILIRRGGLLFKSIIPADLEVNEQEIEEFYARTGVEIKVAHILLKSPALADSLYDSLQKGADFAKLARAYSTDRITANQGGVINRYYTAGELVPSFEEAAFALDKDQIAPPVQTTFGNHIIKLLDKKKREQQPYENVKDDIRNKIRRSKENQLTEKYIKDLFEKYKLAIDDSLCFMIQPAYLTEARRSYVDLKQLPEDLLNKKVISFSGGDMALAEFIREYNSTPGNTRFSLLDKEGVENFVKTAIVRKLMYQEAKQLHLDQTEEFLKEFLHFKEQILKNHSRQQLIYAKISVTEEEVKAYYESNKEEFSKKPAESKEMGEKPSEKEEFEVKPSESKEMGEKPAVKEELEVKPFEKVKAVARHRVRGEKIKKQLDQEIARLRQKYPIKYNDSILRALVDRLNADKKA